MLKRHPGEGTLVCLWVIIVTALKVNILNSVSIFVYLFDLEVVTGFKWKSINISFDCFFYLFFYYLCIFIVCVMECV
jgi:hypothetical protein